MKKGKIQALLFAVAAMLLPSCLGDTHSSQESGNTIGYVTSAPSGLGTVAYVAGFGYVTSDEIRDPNKFAKGRFYEMSLKYDSSNGVTGDGALNVTDVRFVNVFEDPIPDPWMDRRVPSCYDVQSIPEDNREIFITQFGLQLFSPSQELFDDKFVFSYACILKEDDIESSDDNSTVAKDYKGKVELVAYLDRSNQKQGTTGEAGITPALDDDKIRLNIMLRRTSTGEPALDAKDVPYKGWAVIDLSEVRKVFEANDREIEQNDDEQKIGYIQLQYKAYNSSDKDNPTIRTMGSFVPGADDVIRMSLDK